MGDQAEHQEWITYHPLAAPAANAETPDISAVERMLEEWFGRPALLLASGRTGLRLVLRELGLTRYQSSVFVPDFLSRCVINAVTHQAFPVTRPGAEATLLYHQYGFPQVFRPEPPVVEDLAHAFFATATSGSRTWAGDFAIFSLPKFFAVRGWCGGVIGPRSEIDRLRELVSQPADAARADVVETRAWMATIYRDSVSLSPTPTTRAWLDSAYELLFHLESVDPAALVGMTGSLGAIREAGLRRATYAARFRDQFGDREPEGLWPDSAEVIPYALPLFPRADTAELFRARDALHANGVDADVYHLDVARNMTAPDYRRCLLVPAHHAISETAFDDICRTLAHTTTVRPSR